MAAYPFVDYPLHEACNTGLLEAARQLLEGGTDASSRVSNSHPDTWRRGTTPLVVAAGGGHAPIVSLLIRHGAAANQAMQDGWTPLHIAAQNGHLPVVQCPLLQKQLFWEYCDKRVVQAW